MNDILGAIDSAIDTWLLGEDAANWRPEPATDSYGRVPYFALEPHEQEALHAWCELHGVPYRRVPIDALIEKDPVADEWRIETYRQNSQGCPFLVDGEIAKAILRRAIKAELPWPLVQVKPDSEATCHE